MKKIVILALFFTSFTMTINAVNYRSVGSDAEFCAYQFDGQYYLILSFKDNDDNRLTDDAIVKFKLNNGEIITLSGGINGSKKTNQSHTHWGFGISSIKTSDKHYTIFYITKEEIELFKVGIDAVAINTIPEVYVIKKWWGKDKFGINLYNDFMKSKGEFE